MGLGELGFSAVVSLRAVDNWIAVLNSNMAGSARAGFKATRVKFSGNTTSIQRAPTSSLQGIMIGEQNLTTAQTTLDFSQGSVVASTEPTHLALQQANNLNVPFFVLRQGTTATPPVLAGPEFYTRDGEFHFDENGYLRNQDGLYVIDAGGNVLDSIPNGNPGDSGADDDIDAATGAINLDRVLIRFSTAPQVELQFSDFGSTIFEGVTANLGNTATVNAQGDMTSGATNIGRMVPNSLEASNASLAQTVPELSLAQKMYTAIAKVIQVTHTNIDTVLNLLR